MVNYPDSALDRTFAALADPTRRAMLALLRQRSRTVSELAQPFPMSLPAVMKHVEVLVNAGLVAREKNGRTVVCTLRAQPMGPATEWLRHYQRLWDESPDRLDDYLQRLQRAEADGRRSG